MKIIDRGVVLRGRLGTEQQSVTFPGIAVLPSGRWIASMRGAPNKGGTKAQHALLTWSDDEGQTWSAPIEPFTPPLVDGRPGMLRCVYATSLGGTRVLATLMWVDHSNPDLPLFNEATEGILDCVLFLALSEDNGANWGEPWRMETGPFAMPLAITGPTLVLPNGEWMSQFELNKRYHDTPVWRHSSVFMFSRDGGRTWPEHTIASNDPENRVFYWDQRPGLLADGSLLDLFWSYDNVGAEYLNIHGRAFGGNGRGASSMWDTGVPGQPAPPISLPDGGTLMVYVDRTAAAVIKARVSHDGGRSFPADTEIVLQESAGPPPTEDKGSMQDAWAEMGKFSMGLPATALLGDGDVLVVYYNGRQADDTDIFWVRLRG